MRAREEHQLRQLRPRHLPPIEGTELAERLGRTGRSSSGQDGSDDLMTTARELDRQTSIGHFGPLDAMRYLEESGLVEPREPEYFNRQRELQRLWKGQGQ